jgi:hypothetical protein
MVCGRNFSRSVLESNLRAGKIAVVDRSDAPELEDLLEWQRQGLVMSEMIDTGTNSSVLKFRWTGPQYPDDSDSTAPLNHNTRPRPA